MYQRPPQAVVIERIALCMVVEPETATRQLIQPRTPKRRAFFLNVSKMMEIEQTKPTGVIKIPKDKIYPGSFVVRNKGNCMDSEQAVMRVKDGDYMLCHPIELEEAVGKVVVISTPVDHYTKQAVRITKKHLVVSCFKPYRADVFFPLSDIMKIYSVDEILENPMVEKLETEGR